MKHLLFLALLSLTFRCSSAPQDSKAKLNSPSKTGEQNPATPEAVDAGPTTDEEGVNPPQQVTGAYMTASVLPAEADNLIKVGIIGMLDDVRLSDEDELYKSSWTLTFAQALPVTVRITKSTDKKYDQILEFFGTQEQFEQYAAQVDINLQFQENRNGAIVNSVVVSALSDLVP